VSVDNTAAGDLVSAVIEVVPDLHTRTLSVLIPPVHLKNEDKASVKTAAIFSTYRTSIAGPNLVFGQVITYEIEELSGTASFVMT
jgi:hypothetical protein